EPALQAAEVQGSIERRTSDLTAYDLYLRALPLAIMRGRERIAQALDLLERAIDRDPDYGPALALAAYCQVYLFSNGLAENSEIARRSALRLAQRALEIAADDPGVLANAAFVIGAGGEDINAAIALIDRSLTLNPSSARGWYVSAALKNWMGDWEVAIDHV